MVFDTRGERDCVVQYLIDKYPPATYPYNWAIGLGSSYRYKGKCRDSLGTSELLQLILTS